MGQKQLLFPDYCLATLYLLGVDRSQRFQVVVSLVGSGCMSFLVMHGRSVNIFSWPLVSHCMVNEICKYRGF